MHYHQIYSCSDSKIEVFRSIQIYDSRIRQSCTQRCYRHSSRYQEEHCSNKQYRYSAEEVQSKCCSESRGNTLSALESEYSRETVSEDYACECRHGTRFSAKVVTDRDGYEGLHYINNEYDDAGVEAHDPYRVGHARIAASFLADVDALDLPDNDRRIDVSDRICTDTDNYKSYDICSVHLRSPLFSLQTNLIDVPSKLKASLILFSRYLA